MPAIVGALFAAAATVILNAVSAALVFPSLTLIVMFEYVPTLARCRRTRQLPVRRLNIAHAGRFVIENVSASPSPSAAVGLEACTLWPTVTV